MTVEDHREIAPKDREVFVGEPRIHKRGHVGEFWSDEDRLSHVRCSCGWTERCPMAAELVYAWRRHVSGTANLL